MKILNLLKLLFAADFFKELIQRLRAESPNFFKKLQWVTGLLGSAFIILQIVVASGYLPKIAPLMDTINSLVLMLSGAFGVSFMAKKDSTDPKDPPPPKP